MKENSLFFSFWRAYPTPPAHGPIFQVAPGLGKSEAQTYGLRPPPLASEMPRGPAWTLKIVPWAGGVGSWWLIGEKVVNVLSFDSNLKEKNRKAKIENKWHIELNCYLSIEFWTNCWKKINQIKITS